MIIEVNNRTDLVYILARTEYNTRARPTFAGQA